MQAGLQVPWNHSGTLLRSLVDFVGYITKVLHGHLPIDNWETQNNDYLDSTDHGTDALQCIVAHKAWYFEPMIQKMTISTTLAKAEQIATKEIPIKFCKYKKVFLDEEAQKLPKHQL